MSATEFLALGLADEALGLAEGIAEMITASGYGSWEERMMREGDLWSGYANGSVAAPGTGVVTTPLASFTNVPIIGKATYIKSLTISADQPCIIQSSISGSDGTTGGRFPAHTQQVVVSAGGPVTIPLNVLIRSFNDFNGVIGITLRKLLTAAGSETVNGAISASGVTIADDIDFDAPKTILVIGDSRDNGESGTKTANLYKFKFKASLAAIGTRARLVYKARSGLNLAEQLAFAQAGWHDISRVSLGILDLGVNDAAQGVTGAAYTANLATYWSLFKSRNPAAKLIIVGPSPLARAVADHIGSYPAASKKFWHS